MAKVEGPETIWNSPYPVVLVYIVISGLWIVLSDYVVFYFVKDAGDAASLSIIKGLAFIALTSLLIYFLVRKGFHSLKQSESSAKRIGNLYRSMFESSPIATLEVDLEGRIVRTNQAFVDLINGKGDDLIGKRLDSLFTSRPMESLDWSAVIKTDLKVVAAEGTLRRADSTEVICNVVTSVVHDEAGKAAFFVVMIEDITERKAHTAVLEAKVAERTAELSSIADRLAVTLQSIADGVVVTDPRGTVVMCNPAAKALLGDIMSKMLVDILPIGDGTSNKNVVEPLSGDHLSASCSSTLSVQGTEKHISFTSSPILTSEDELRGMVVVLRDETLKVQMEEEMAKAKRLESIGHLAGGLAHNLNNLLTIIEGNIELARLEYPTTAAKMNDAHTAVKRGRGLASRLITFSKGGKPILTSVPVRSMLEDVVAQVQDERPININYDVPKSAWNIYADKVQMVQALSAVITYASRGPHATALSIHVANMEGKNKVDISISSHQLFLDAVSIDRLLDPEFERRDSLELDLSIADFIISRHGGRLIIESSPEKGTTFIVRLPRAPQANDHPAPVGSKGKRILWMDDEALLRDLNQSFLEALGHRGDMAAEGGEALKMFDQARSSSRPYDLVILDLCVPNGMGGLETYRELKAIDPRTRVIVCSGYCSDPVMSDWQTTGFDGVLPKPYGINELAKAIDSATY